MKIKHCPDCSTGWRYADDLPNRHDAPHHHGLVQCPTCNGQGRTLEPDAPPVQLAHAAAKRRQRTIAARHDGRRAQNGVERKTAQATA